VLVVATPWTQTARSLYVRDLRGLCSDSGDWELHEEDTHRSFNTYFSSFYESYWLENTGIQNLFLEFDLSGCVLLEIYRDTPSGGCYRIAAEKVRETEGRVRVPVPLFREGQLGEPGRIFFDLTAITESRIKGVAFTTSTPPAAEAALTLGICTFNREPFLLRNLQALEQAQDQLLTLKNIIVVNQGAEFADPDLVELLADNSRYTLIQQRNFGGCGGFTRTMYEALEHHEVSHHVLMDDDTTLDPQILANLALFLGYVSRDVVVGGHMLDLLRPCVLYEAGAMVRGDARIEPQLHNVDLREVTALAPFSRARTVDYNAWWLCALPTRHMREALFPAPIFIRGDDVEYGVRMRERGVKTIAMPGIAVWHEPFYVKVGGWQAYYDLRNRLILASAYPERFKTESPKRVLWAMMRALAVHDYGMAKLLVCAVRDFLQGPALLEADPETLHQQVAALARSSAPQDVETLPASRKGSLRAPWRDETKIALGLTFRIAGTLLTAASKRTPTKLLDADAHPANVGKHPYVRTNGLESYKLLYRPDRNQLLHGVCHSLITVLAYTLSRKAVSQQWHKGVVALRSPSRWASLFASPRS